MRLSQRADYAAHAMVEIARWYGERRVHATEIARRQGIPEPYLEQLLLALRRAALVRSYRGPGGGYTLTRPPAAISRRILDGMTLEVLVERQREIERKSAAGAAARKSAEGTGTAEGKRDE